VLPTNSVFALTICLQPLCATSRSKITATATGRNRNYPSGSLEKQVSVLPYVLAVWIKSSSDTNTAVSDSLSVNESSVFGARSRAERFPAPFMSGQNNTPPLKWLTNSLRFSADPSPDPPFTHSDTMQGAHPSVVFQAFINRPSASASAMRSTPNHCRAHHPPKFRHCGSACSQCCPFLSRNRACSKNDTRLCLPQKLFDASALRSTLVAQNIPKMLRCPARPTTAQWADAW